MLSSYSEIFSQKDQLSVSHMGEAKWTVQHHFDEPASEESIKQAEAEMGFEIPQEIKDFWAQSNGALLFKSTKPPEWGWRVVSTNRYLEGQHKWRRKFFDTWKMEFIVIAELLMPFSVVVYNPFTKKVLFLDTSSRDMQEVLIADGITDFFTKLYESQGSLYWKW